MGADPWPQIPGLRILGSLGRGGMGEVVVAEEEDLGRRVAVKWIAPAGDGDLRELDRADRERFEREARTLARLDHPHLVQVHRMGEVAGRPYMVLELVEGGSLSERLRERGALPLGEALEIAAETVSGLGAAWSRGVVHRDVKPSNLLFDLQGRVKVADFGLALAVGGVEERVTRTGFIVGSPHYMSPEQIRGEELDPRSDLYSVGVVLFEMLAGSPPFDGRSQGAILAGHLSEPLPDPRRLRPALPEEAVRLVERLTAKEAAARPGSVDEVLAAIERVGRGPAPTPMPPAPAAPREPEEVTASLRGPFAGRGDPGTGSAPAAQGSGTRGAGRWIAAAAVLGLALAAGAGLLTGPRSAWLRGDDAPPVDGRQRESHREASGAADGAAADSAAGSAADSSGPGGLRLAGTARPAALDLPPAAPAAELARALEARAPVPTRVDPLDAVGRGVRVRVASASHPLLFHLRADGDLELLHPPPGGELRPLEPARAHRLPGPTGGPDGWLVLVATAEPLEPPALLGARPVAGRVLYPARLEGATGTVHPAHGLIAWLIDNLGATSGRWGLAIRSLTPAAAPDQPD